VIQGELSSYIVRVIPAELWQWFRPLTQTAKAQFDFVYRDLNKVNHWYSCQNVHPIVHLFAFFPPFFIGRSFEDQLYGTSAKFEIGNSLMGVSLHR
jgi:hypothetical protein